VARQTTAVQSIQTTNSDRQGTIEAHDPTNQQSTKLIHQSSVPGWKEDFIFSALAASSTMNVYRYRDVRSLNLVLPLAFFLILTAAHTHKHKHIRARATHTTVNVRTTQPTPRGTRKKQPQSSNPVAKPTCRPNTGTDAKVARQTKQKREKTIHRLHLDTLTSTLTWEWRGDA
jgi:hypothetical protein